MIQLLIFSDFLKIFLDKFGYIDDKVLEQNLLLTFFDFAIDNLIEIMNFIV